MTVFDMDIIRYKKTENGYVNLWRYDEGDPKTDKDRTAMIWIHGGGWHSTDPGIFGSNYSYFTKLNAVCFGVEYRLAPEESDVNCRFLERCIRDCLDAIDYVRDNCGNYGVSPKKLVVIGESAGGHLALCTVTDVAHRFGAKRFPALAVAFDPVTDVTGKWGDAACRLDKNLSCEEFLERYNRLREMSPADNIVKNGVPLLLLTGIEDKVVHPGEVMSFFRKYQEAGNEAEAVFYPDTVHAFALPDYYKNGLSSLEDSLRRIADFMKKYGFL